MPKWVERKPYLGGYFQSTIDKGFMDFMTKNGKKDTL